MHTLRQLRYMQQNLVNLCRLARSELVNELRNNAQWLCAV